MIPITDGVDECPICLEEYDQKTSRKNLECNHSICVFCFYHSSIKSCPLCRSIIDKPRLSIFNIGFNPKSINIDVPDPRECNLLMLLKSIFRC